MDYKVEKQHSKGKLHAIERIRKLLDPGSFVELGQGMTHYHVDLAKEMGATPYDGVITGFGEMDGKKVCIYSQDFTVMGGTLGKQHGKKIADIIKLAIECKCPVIGINDSGGARIQEGVHALAGYGEVFYYNTKASGYIPQISIIAGPCAGGAVYSPGITDFIFVIDKVSNMFVTGPKVVKAVTNAVVTTEQLGGATMHASQSGVAHFISPNELECYEKVKKLVSMLPSCYEETKTTHKHAYEPLTQEMMGKVLPAKNNKAYDMKDIIAILLDTNSFLEVQEKFAPNIVIGFGKLSKKTVGIIANQPSYMAGVLDCDASDKAARFIRYCDAFNIPIITLTDVPGFMPGITQETRGIIRHGAKLLYAYSEATTIKLNVIIRKAYGGAYIAMSSKHLGADFVYAWPTAEVAVMGGDGAVDILYKKDIDQYEGDKEKFKEEKIQEYNAHYLSPRIAQEAGYIDDVIEPQKTREILFRSLVMLEHKKEYLSIPKKHGNIPL